MKTWHEINKISEQALCLSCVDILQDFCNQTDANFIKIKVKRDISGSRVLCGYASLEISIDVSLFDYKYLVSWDDTKYEPIEFWLTTLREKYIVCKNEGFSNDLLELYRELNNSWQSLSNWIVHNTDINQIELNKDSNVKNELLGRRFNKNLENYKLNLLLNDEQIKENIKKL